MAIPRLRVSGNNEERIVHPNHIIYQKMENLVNAMLDPENGVPIKTVKSFLSKVGLYYYSIYFFLFINLQVANREYLNIIK